MSYDMWHSWGEEVDRKAHRRHTATPTMMLGSRGSFSSSSDSLPKRRGSASPVVLRSPPGASSLSKSLGRVDGNGMYKHPKRHGSEPYEQWRWQTRRQSPRLNTRRGSLSPSCKLFQPLRLSLRSSADPLLGQNQAKWGSEPFKLNNLEGDEQSDRIGLGSRWSSRRASAPATNALPRKALMDSESESSTFSDGIPSNRLFFQSIISTYPGEQSVHEIGSVAQTLDTLRQDQMREMELVQKRMLLLSIILCFVGPIVIMAISTTAIITPPFVIGVLILTTIGDMNIDQLLIRNMYLAITAFAILLVSTVITFVPCNWDDGECDLAEEHWPSLLIIIFIGLNGRTIAIQSPYRLESKNMYGIKKRTEDSTLPYFSHILTVYVISWISAESAASYNLRQDEVARWLTTAEYSIGALVALYILSKRASQNRGATRTLFIVLCIYIGCLGLGAIIAGIRPEHDCYAFRYRPPRNCVETGDFASQTMFIAAGALYIALVPAVYYWRRHIFGMLTWVLWLNNRTKTGAVLSSLFATRDTDFEDLARAGAVKFRSVKMSDVPDCGMIIDSEFSRSAYECSRPAKLATVDYYVCVFCDEYNAVAVERLLLRKATTVANEQNHEPTFWIAPLCRNREDPEEIKYLPVFVAGCKRTLVILGDGFFDNLGCVINLYMAMAMHTSPSLIEILSLDDNNDPQSRELHNTLARFDVSQTTWHNPIEEELFREAIIRSGGRIKFNNAIRNFQQYIDHECAKRSKHVRNHVAYSFDTELQDERIQSIRRRASNMSVQGGEQVNDHTKTSKRIPKRPTELDRSSILLLDELGSGDYGLVRKGLYSSGVVPEFEVAVKMLMPMPSEEDRRQLLREAALTGQFQHPNVVSLIGVVTVGDPIMMVLQYCAQGSLLSVLKSMASMTQNRLSLDPSSVARRQTLVDSNGQQYSEVISSGSGMKDRLISFCLGLSTGMAYLASKRFVHCDIAARNVLVDAADKVKVSDFGLSHTLIKESVTYYRALKDTDKMPVRWASPEVMKERKFSEKSDVWAFGVTAIEVFDLGKTPYGSWATNFVVERVMDGYIPEAPNRCPMSFYNNIVKPCFAMESEDRPTFSEIKQKCEEVLNATSTTNESTINDSDRSFSSFGTADVKGYLRNVSTSTSQRPSVEIPQELRLTRAEKEMIKNMSEESIISLFRHAANREFTPISGTPSCTPNGSLDCLSDFSSENSYSHRQSSSQHRSRASIHMKRRHSSPLILVACTGELHDSADIKKNDGLRQNIGTQAVEDGVTVAGTQGTESPASSCSQGNAQTSTV